MSYEENGMHYVKTSNKEDLIKNQIDVLQKELDKLIALV